MQKHLSKIYLNPLSANITKFFKHTQTIRRQIADELFECVSPFCGIDASRVKIQDISKCMVLKKAGKTVPNVKRSSIVNLLKIKKL